MPRTVYNQKSDLLNGSGSTTIYSPANTKFLLKYFHIYFLIKKY